MTPLPWQEVELAIQKEERWLREILDFGPYTETASIPRLPNLSPDKMLRQIATLIVQGDIQAREIKNPIELGLWSSELVTIDEIDTTNERHGDHWHQSMMSLVKEHFINDGFKVINEPFLSHGRADLGVYKKGYQNLFVEIGTTSLYKTWLNTRSMPSTIFLFIPTTTYAVELATSDMLNPEMTSTH